MILGLWHLVGVAARMCFELGLHRESLYQTRGDQEVNPDRLVAAEVRRRCFFCVLAIDRYVSLQFIQRYLASLTR